MNDWKPMVRVPVAFKKISAVGSRTIRLTLLSDGSIYLDGAEELIFDQGESPLKSAIEYLQKKGYKKV